MLMCVASKPLGPILSQIGQVEAPEKEEEKKRYVETR